MTNSIAKRALTVAVAAATILWSVGFAALVPQQASAASYGDLIKGTTLSTVYYYGSDGQRYSFPNEKTFFSWYNDFSGVVTMSDAELANITLAGNIVYRPGAHWIKITSDNKTYAVARDGSVHWIESEAVAKGLAGDDWNQFIDDVPDVFFVDYSVGDSLTSAASAYEGALVKSGSDTYLVWGGKKMKVTSAGMTANRFKAGFVLDGSGVNLTSMTAGNDVTGALAYLTDAGQMVTTDTYETAKSVSVSVSGSPAATTLIAGQGIADLLHVTLTNNSASEVKLTKLAVTRTGVSGDTTLSNLYLFDGFVRVSDSATVSSGKATFNDASGLWTLAPGASKTLAVRSNIATGTSGQTVGLKIAAAADLGFTSNGQAGGAYPMEGSLHTIATMPSTFATADFTGSTTPTAASDVQPAEAIKVFERTLAIGANEVWLKTLRFRNIGSIDADDVTNWQLYVGGTKRGSAVVMEDEDGYITFDLSAAPVEVKTGNHQVKVTADVIGGSGRTVQLGLRNSADVVLTDADYSQAVLPTVGASTFAAMDAGAQTIASGSLTFTKTTDSPSGDVVETASGLTLGKWTVKAFGENMKIEKLRFAFTESDGADVSLRNGAVFLNGTQIGSTTALEANAGAGTDYTEYTFGSSFVVEPGKPATLEIRADIYDNDGTDGIEADDTIQAEITDMNNTSNVQRVVSGSYIDAPDGSVNQANVLTVVDSSTLLTLAKNTSYGNQSTVDPKTNFKIGSFTVTAGTAESINLTDINVDLDTDVADSTTELFNLYVKYGPQNNMVTTSTKGTIAETANAWSINYPLKKGETIYFDVYADLDSNLEGGTDTVIAVLDVGGNADLSGTTQNPSEVAGQTVTIASGSFDEFNDDHPVAAVAAGNQEVTAAKYRFSALNDVYTITEMTTSVTSAAVAAVVSEVRLYDGSQLLASTVYDENTNTRATWTGLSIPVAASSNKILTVKYLLNTISPSAGASQQNVANTLYSVEVADSNGTKTTETSGAQFSSINGNALYVYASVPTVTAVDLTNSTLVNGQATDLYKFTVTASSKGPIALKQLKFPVTFSDGGGADTLEMESWKIYRNGSDVTSTVVLEDNGGVSIESTTGVVEAETTVVAIWDTNEEVIGAGETVTYTLRATPQFFDNDGTTGTEDDFTIYLAGDTSAHNGSDVCLEDSGSGNIWELDAQVSGLCTTASISNSAYNFIWSDLSGESDAVHAGGTETGAADWANGYLVLNLDLTGETWSK